MANLTEAEYHALSILCKYPFKGHQDICDIAYCSGQTLTLALLKTLEGESVKSRIRLFDRMGYIHIKSRATFKPRRLHKIFDALKINPSATHAELAELSGYAPYTVQSMIPMIYRNCGYYNKTLPSRLVRLHFYASMGWFDVERLQKEGLNIGV